MDANIVVHTLAASGDGDNGRLRLKPKPCTGISRVAFDKPAGLYWLHYNSCDAGQPARRGRSRGVALGFTSAVMGVITEGLAFRPPAVEGMCLYLTAKDMDRAINASDVEGMIIRATNVGKSSDAHYYVPLRIFPQ